MNATLTQVSCPALVLGPAYSGKSVWAHQLLLPTVEAHVLGTAPESEPAFRSRIATLRDMRPATWESRPVTGDLALALGDSLGGSSPCPQILIDSLSQWIAVLAVSLPVRTEEALTEELLARVAEFLQVLTSCRSSRVVVVSAEVGAGPSPSRPLERVFRHVVGIANQKLAAHCATVVSIQAGLPQFLKR